MSCVIPGQSEGPHPEPQDISIFNMFAVGRRWVSGFAGCARARNAGVLLFLHTLAGGVQNLPLA